MIINILSTSASLIFPAAQAVKLAIGITMTVFAMIFPLHSADSFVILGFIPNEKSHNDVVVMISRLTIAKNHSPPMNLEVMKDVFDHYQLQYWLNMLQNR